MKIQARSAIEKGFTAQFTKSVTPIPFQCAFTWCSAPKSILRSIGTIITQMSAPTGRFTFATSRRPMAANAPGNTRPSTMPATMQAPPRR